MSLEDDIARQAFHVEQLEQSYTRARHYWEKARASIPHNWQVIDAYKKSMQDLHLLRTEGNQKLREMCLKLPLSLPPDPRWGR